MGPQLQLSSDSLTVTINRAGAEVSSIADQQGLQYLWQADKTVWGRHAPVLFPIVGKLKNNAYTFNRTGFSLPQHGFARDMLFSIIETRPECCLLELKANGETWNIYPFDFVLRISYQLQNNRLTCTYQVSNSGKEIMWFSIGAHPGFNCPLQPHETFEDYYLEFEPGRYERTVLLEGLRSHDKQALALDNNRLYLTEHLFDNDALVFENTQVSRIALASKASAHRIEMECTGWPYFGIWAKKGARRFICLEPWQGIADALDSSGLLAEKEGIIELAPGRDFSCSFKTTFS